MSKLFKSRNNIRVNLWELSGVALDYAVAIGEEKLSKIWIITKPYVDTPYLQINDASLENDDVYSPSTDWSQGGPIIEREKISLLYYDQYQQWEAGVEADRGYGVKYSPISQIGDTPLIAAMRCYVASKLGDEVEIPEELK